MGTFYNYYYFFAVGDSRNEYRKMGSIDYSGGGVIKLSSILAPRTVSEFGDAPSRPANRTSGRSQRTQAGRLLVRDP